MTEPTLLPAPASLFSGTRPNVGRYSGPIPIVNLGGSGLTRFRLKEWHYTAITTDRFFVAFAVVQLGYAANLRRRPAAALARPHDRACDSPRSGTQIRAKLYVWRHALSTPGREHHD